MAETAGQLTASLLRRIRNPSGLAGEHAFARSMISYAQWYVNASVRDTLTTASFTTTPQQMLYTITPFLTQAIRIEAVKQGGRNLKSTTIRELGHVSTKWFRDTGPQFEQYALVGRDLLVLYPAVKEAVTLEIVQTSMTTVMSSDAIEFELRDDTALPVLDMAEVLMSLKRRDTSLVAALVKRYGPRAEPNDNQSRNTTDRK